MKTLRSHVTGEWHQAQDGFAEVADPSTEQPIARVSSSGVDFGEVLRFARQVGGPALRASSLSARGTLLLELSKALHAARDGLIELSVEATGTTRRDAKFDIDGAIFTLAHYGHLGEALAERPFLTEGDGEALGRSSRFWGQHVFLPLRGAAVHINAFNFPAWGLAEKAACAWLAGMPVISKPATSTAILTERCAEVLIESDLLPRGALQLICGSTGDLLDRLGPQDVMAFTGSANTARRLQANANVMEQGTRVNIEADSLNPAVLAADVEPGSELWDLFVRDVVREMTQKTGQKCTAVRRIFVPEERADRVVEAFSEALGDVVTGDPRDGSVTMGPLATRQQLDDAIAGTAELEQHGRRVFGDGQRVDGVGAEAGRGYFFGPTLLRCDDAAAGSAVHHREVFGPVSTVLPYDGSAGSAAAGVAAGGGCLVGSLYSDDAGFVGEFVGEAAATLGRLYLGSTKVAGQLPGSGVAMPALQHGGPGRAGGGSELGGLRGVELYLQRVALQGDRIVIERLGGRR